MEEPLKDECFGTIPKLNCSVFSWLTAHLLRLFLGRKKLNNKQIMEYPFLIGGICTWEVILFLSFQDNCLPAIVGQTDTGTDSEGAIDPDGQLVQPVEYEKQRHYGAEETAKTQRPQKKRAESILHHHCCREETFKNRKCSLLTAESTDSSVHF